MQDEYIWVETVGNKYVKGKSLWESCDYAPHDYSFLTFRNNTPTMKSIRIEYDQRASTTLNCDRFPPGSRQIPDGYVFHTETLAQVTAANLSPPIMCAGDEFKRTVLSSCVRQVKVELERVDPVKVQNGHWFRIGQVVRQIHGVIELVGYPEIAITYCSHEVRAKDPLRNREALHIYVIAAYRNCLR